MAILAEKQEKVLLGLVAGKTRAECAVENGVAESTIYNWLNDENFRARLKDAQSQVYAESTAQIYGLASLAIEALKDGLEGKGTALTIRTAIALATEARRRKEIDLAERIERLEIMLEAK